MRLKIDELKVKCKYCGHEQIIEKDIHKIVGKNVIQAYSCEKCGKVNSVYWKLFNYQPREEMHDAHRDNTRWE